MDLALAIELQKGLSLSGHLASSMIGLSFGIFHSFEFVFPSIKLSCLLTYMSQKRLCMSQHISQVIHSRRRRHTSMLVAVSANGRGSMCEKEVARNLAHLLMFFTVRDHLALFRQQSNQNNKTRTSSIGSQTAIAQHGIAI
jgi:hypothetical protein